MVPFNGLEPVDRRPTAGIIADKIRARIRDGTFTAGTQLGEVRLAESLGVSRGPVREALQRLVQEGLLESRPHRGVFVRTLDPEEIADVYLARSAIEGEAVRRLAAHTEPADLEPLDTLLEQMGEAARSQSWDDVAELDLEFHLALVATSGSRRLLRMYDTLIVETSMCLRALEPSYSIQEDLVAEHRELYEAVVDGDPERAAALVDQHLQLAVDQLTAG